MTLLDVPAFVSGILEGIRNLWSFLRNTFNWAWSILIAALLVPVNFVLQMLDSWVQFLIGQWVHVNNVLRSLGLFNLGQDWQGMSTYLGYANAVMPINLAAALFMALLVLWAICMIVRLILKWASWG